MVRKPMQDIVPKGRTIRSVTRREDPREEEGEKVEIKVRTPKVAEQVERTRKPDKKREIIIDREEMETVVEAPPEEIERRESLRLAREEFEERRAKKTKRSRKSGASIFEPFRAFFQEHRMTSRIVMGIVLVIGLATLTTGIFKSALVTVTPRTLAFTANTDLVAKKNASTSDLPYTLTTIKLSGSQTVRATGQKQVSTRATGTIVVYNNYNATPQRLIKNTRFATPEGLIFRISDSVTVPGKKGTVPGSIEATVIADELGMTYNVGLKDFTIPGFKGDPRYGAFYARSKTPLAGGFVGIQKIVADADRAKAKLDIETKLRDELLRQVALKQTDATVFYSNAYTIDFMSQPDETVSANEANIKEDGVINAIVFDKKQLAGALARVYVKDYKGDVVTVPLISTLVFSAKDLKSATADSIAFHLAGNASFEWVYDEASLKTALKGHSRSETPSILRKFPMIEKADISLRPFWASAFPGSEDKITIKRAP